VTRPPPRAGFVITKRGALSYALCVITAVCECGCGETFTREYRTARPRFKNKTHRLRAWNEKHGLVKPRKVP